MRFSPFWIVVHTRPRLFGGGVPLAMALAFLLMWGCISGARSQGAERDVQWYLENPRALDGATRACRSNPGRLERSADCRNAQAARLQAARGVLADLIGRAEADWAAAQPRAVPPPPQRAPRQRRTTVERRT